MRTQFLFFFFFVILFNQFPGFAQQPGWMWARTATCFNINETFDCSADNNGNAIITGYYNSSSVSFGSYTLNQTNGSSSDIFVVKYDSLGNVRWVTGPTGNLTDIGEGVSTDANGNIFVTGYFESASLNFGNTLLSNAGGADVFLAKYDPTGNFIWAKSFGGTSDEQGLKCSADVNGNTIVVGTFTSSTLTLGPSLLINSGNQDLFVAKFDSSGNILWAKSAGGLNNDLPHACAVDGAGNIVVCGEFYSPTLHFGSFTLNEVDTTLSDLFVVKYDPLGNVVWAQGAGGSSNERGMGCSFDFQGNIFITGDFNGLITFYNINLSSSGSEDVFVVKYNSSGLVQWAKTAGGSGLEMGVDCSTDTYGNIIVSGNYGSNTLSYGNLSLSHSGGWGNDMFVLKIDPFGNGIWMKSAGGSSFDYNKACFASSTGDVFFAGTFYSYFIAFGSDTLEGNGAMYLAKLRGNVTGIRGPKNKIRLSIFPNPFSNETTIESDASLSRMTIKLYDVYGKELKLDQKIIGNSITIERNNLPKGIYHIRLQNDEGIFAQEKLIVN